MNHIVLIENKSVITTSILVAKKFERNHRDILRAIKNLDCSPEFSERNFALAEMCRFYTLWVNWILSPHIKPAHIVGYETFVS